MKLGFYWSKLLICRKRSLCRKRSFKGLCTSHLYPRPPPTGIAVGYGAVQVLFDCPRSTGELRGF